jgi:hypothetical protein
MFPPEAPRSIDDLEFHEHAMSDHPVNDATEPKEGIPEARVRDGAIQVRERICSLPALVETGDVLQAPVPP